MLTHLAQDDAHREVTVFDERVERERPTHEVAGLAYESHIAFQERDPSERLTGFRRMAMSFIFGLYAR